MRRMACALGAMLLFVGTVSAIPLGTYLESGGIVAGEGEGFTARVPTSYPDNWLIVPDEDAGAGTLTGARNGKYVQSLPDQAGSGGGPNVPPEAHYGIFINTPGTYQLYLRWANNTNVGGGGNSDSMFADIIEIKDGAGGAADWYEITRNTATFTWDGGGQAEINAAGAADNPMTWILSPGLYTLRISQREDGSAVDAWALQRNNLPAPSGTAFGPEVSQVYPEPATLTLLALGGIGAWIRRRKR